MLYDAMECILRMLCEANSWFLWGVTPADRLICSTAFGRRMMMMMMILSWPLLLRLKLPISKLLSEPSGFIILCIYIISNKSLWDFLQNLDKLCGMADTDATASPENVVLLLVNQHFLMKLAISMAIWRVDHLLTFNTGSYLLFELVAG